jgi:hypothetical protein
MVVLLLDASCSKAAAMARWATVADDSHGQAALDDRHARIFALTLNSPQSPAQVGHSLLFLKRIVWTRYGCPLAQLTRMMELLASLETSGSGTWLRESGSIWAYPAVLTLHTMGLGVLVGASTVLDLRLLGCAPRIPLEPLERLFPIMWAGFWVNAISGVALFVADATTKGTTTVFMAKLAIVVVAIWVLRRLKKVVYGGRAGADTAMGARVLAATSLALWIAAIATGRYMAYV